MVIMRRVLGFLVLRFREPMCSFFVAAFFGGCFFLGRGSGSAVSPPPFPPLSRPRTGWPPGRSLGFLETSADDRVVESVVTAKPTEVPSARTTQTRSGILWLEHPIKPLTLKI